MVVNPLLQLQDYQKHTASGFVLEAPGWSTYMHNAPVDRRVGGLLDASLAYHGYQFYPYDRMSQNSRITGPALDHSPLELKLSPGGANKAEYSQEEKKGIVGASTWKSREAMQGITYHVMQRNPLEFGKCLVFYSWHMAIRRPS